MSETTGGADAPSPTDPLWDELAQKTAARIEAKAKAEQVGREYSAALTEADRLARLLARGTDSQPLSDPGNSRVAASDEFIAATLLAFSAAIDDSVGLSYFNKHYPLGNFGMAYRAVQRLWQLAGLRIQIEQMMREVGAARRALAPLDKPWSLSRGDSEAGLLDALRQFEGLPSLIDLTVRNDISARCLVHSARDRELPPKVMVILGESPATELSPLDAPPISPTASDGTPTLLVPEAGGTAGGTEQVSREPRARREANEMAVFGWMTASTEPGELERRVSATTREIDEGTASMGHRVSKSTVAPILRRPRHGGLRAILEQYRNRATGTPTRPAKDGRAPDAEGGQVAEIRKPER